MGFEVYAHRPALRFFTTRCEISSRDIKRASLAIFIIITTSPIPSPCDDVYKLSCLVLYYYRCLLRWSVDDPTLSMSQPGMKTNVNKCRFAIVVQHTDILCPIADISYQYRAERFNMNRNMILCPHLIYMWTRSITIRNHVRLMGT